MLRNERILIHLHLPKTAGTTLRTIADRNYTGDEIYTVSQPYAQQGEELRDLPEQRRRKIKPLRGHMPFGLHEHFDKLTLVYRSEARAGDARRYSAVVLWGWSLT
jgi:hypothetical protein